MFDYEGSRSEFLKLLAEFGEEPSFIARGRAPEIALEGLLRGCAAKRQEMLVWPKMHLANLAQRVGGNWSRLAHLLAKLDSVPMLEALYEQMPTDKLMPKYLFTTDRRLLITFLESSDRFNRNWQQYLQSLDLEPVNRPRRDYNRYYLLEKSCAFGNERHAEGFEPLQMISYEYLERRFPSLALPSLA